MNPEPVRGIERETLAEATCRLRAALAAENPPAAVQHAMRAAFAAAMPARAASAQPGVATHPVLAPAVRPPSPGLAHADAITPAARRGARRPDRTGRRWWAAAACASVLVASITLLLLAAQDERSGNTTAAPEPAFVPVAAAERWPRVGPGGAAAWLVAAEMPRERLAEWGLPFDPSRAGEPVRTELLLRPSGEVLAVRVLHNPTAR